MLNLIDFDLKLAAHGAKHSRSFTQNLSTPLITCAQDN